MESDLTDKITESHVEKKFAVGVRKIGSQLSYLGHHHLSTYEKQAFCFQFSSSILGPAAWYLICSSTLAKVCSTLSNDYTARGVAAN